MVMDRLVEKVFPTLAAVTSLLLKLYDGQVDYAAATSFFFWVRVVPPVVTILVIVLVLLVSVPFSHRSSPGQVLQYSEAGEDAGEAGSLQMSGTKRRSPCYLLCCCKKRGDRREEEVIVTDTHSQQSGHITIRRKDKRRDKRGVTFVEPEDDDVIVANHGAKDSGDNMGKITTGFHGDEHVIRGNNFAGNSLTVKEKYYTDEVPLELLPVPEPLRGTMVTTTSTSFSNHEYYRHSDNAYELESLPSGGVGSIISSSESDSAIASPAAGNHGKNSAAGNHGNTSAAGKQWYRPWFLASPLTAPAKVTMVTADASSCVSSQSPRYKSPRADSDSYHGNRADSVSYHGYQVSGSVELNYKLDHVKHTRGNGAEAEPMSDEGSISMISLNCDNGTDSMLSQSLPPPESPISRSLKRNPNLRSNLNRSDFEAIDLFTQTMGRVSEKMGQEDAKQLQSTILSLERIVGLENGEETAGSTRDVNFRQSVDNLDNIMSDIDNIMGEINAWAE